MRSEKKVTRNNVSELNVEMVEPLSLPGEKCEPSLLTSELKNESSEPDESSGAQDGEPVDQRARSRTLADALASLESTRDITIVAAS